MKNLDFEKWNLQEMDLEGMTIINGGSELSEAIARGLGYVCHKVSDAINAVDWNSFYSHAFRYY